MKIKFKRMSLLLFAIFIISISAYKFYITFNCISPSFALEHYTTNNNQYKIDSIAESELIFSSDDLLIYQIKTNSKDFEFEEEFIVKLNKLGKLWILDTIDVKM